MSDHLIRIIFDNVSEYKAAINILNRDKLAHVEYLEDNSVSGHKVLLVTDMHEKLLRECGVMFRVVKKKP